MQEEEEPLGTTLATHNFESQSRPDPRSNPTSPTRQQHRYHHYHPQQPQLQPSPNSAAFDASDYEDYEYNPNLNISHHSTLFSPELASYASSNFQAAHANATTVEPVGVVDPDHFYKPYRDVHTSTQGQAYNELMASALPASRQDQNLSPRSNGNATGPKHPASSSTRPALKPAFRSVSAPIDDKQPGNAAKSGSAATPAYGARSGHQPSVKDLKRRFDQNAAQPSNSTARKATIPRIPVRETSSSPRYHRVSGSSPTNGQTSYMALRSSVTRDLESGTGSSSTTRTTQRNKSVAEDQLSNNSQSFASRIAKPRVSVNSHSQASKSLSSLSPNASPTSAVPTLPSRGLLFGEIPPGERDIGMAGYGIEGTRTRRTSDSNLHNPGGLRQRSLSHTGRSDVDPPSPSDWYRSVNGESAIHDDIETKNVNPARLHKRSHSDVAGTRPSPAPSQMPRDSRPKLHIDRGPPPTVSRLPVSVRKFSSPSGSSSPTSTRSNSPATRRRPPIQGKSAKSTPVARAKTPSSNSSSTTRRPNRLGAVTPNGSTRLNAYISTPPPKLSPPLRSSRPRQPVSSATTASSRMKAVERGRSPSQSDLRPGARASEQGPRRRKISMGPIDFESRREQIKLSYTKSIRENEARAAARRAAEEKKRKAEAEARAKARAKAKAESEAEAEAGVEVDATKIEQPDADEERLGRIREEPSLDTVESPAVPEVPATDQVALTISTNLQQPELDDLSPNSGTIQRDSSTLGGIPGSFPAAGSSQDQDEAPPSAISNTTEFDIEPQVEPSYQEVPVRLDIARAGDEDITSEPGFSKSEYRSPFEDECTNDDVSINVSLEAPVETVLQLIESTATTRELSANQVIPSSYEDGDDDEEYSPRPLPSEPYQTKVTIIGRDSDFSPSSRVVDESASAAISNTRDFRDLNSPFEGPKIFRPFPYSRTTSPNNDQAGPSAGLSEIEEFFVGPMLKDVVAAIPRDSSPKPSEGKDVVSPRRPVTEDSRFSLESRRTMATAPSLNVPRTSNSMNRTSQTTVWTDYSINSQDAYSDYELKNRDLQNRDSSCQDNHSISDSSSLSQPYQYELDSKEVHCSDDIPPQDLESVHHASHQLPELSTGDGFVVDYVNHKDSSIPVLPDHAPPPPPDASSLRDVMSSVPQSEYFDETRPNSYLQVGKDDQSVFSADPSRRESEDFDQSESGSRTVYQGSLDISEGLPAHTILLDSQQTLAESVDQSEEGTGLSAPERKRLFTRLETVKELIDTEAFFIRDMNIVEEIYKGTAEACPKLDDKTIKLIFRNTDQIIKFHSGFLTELKQGVSSIYTPKGHRTQKELSSLSDGTLLSTVSTTATGHLNDARDRQTSIGPIFSQNIEQMKAAHETFLKNSDYAAKRLIQIQEDPTVKVWLNECNEVARDLTKAWNLDSLLIKPMQRITKYPTLLVQLLHETPADHPDRLFLETAKASLENAIEEINKTKKNFELVGQIVGRKRKDSDVRAGLARAFGKRVDKLQATQRLADDPEYLKLHERFGDDYLRLQVVLRDVEFYTRQATEYVHEFLRYLSSMELVMRLQPSPHPEIESKWVRFNVSMRDIEKVALEQHVSYFIYRPLQSF